MTAPLASLQAAREECVASLLIQQRRTAKLAEELSAVLAGIAGRYASARALRAKLLLASELSGADRDAEMIRSIRASDAILEGLVADADSIRPILQSFNSWAAGIELAIAGLNNSANTCPPLATARKGRGDAIVMRNQSAEPRLGFWSFLFRRSA